MKRIPSLDGLRAVSILAVLAAHSVTAAVRGVSTPPALGWLVQSLGLTGVTVFFGISGFIITTLLLDEQKHVGTTDLRVFYTRRAFRILPAYWVFLIVSAIVMPGMQPAHFAKAALFVTDVFPTGRWWLDHTWSLSVEEQFYVVWPIAFALMGVGRLRRIVVPLFVLLPVLRIATHALVLEPQGRDLAVLHLRFDAILFGCIVALNRNASEEHWAMGALRSGPTALAGVAFLAVGSPLMARAFDGSPYFDFVGGAWVGFLAVGAIILWSIENAGSPIGRVLGSRPAVHIGALSYSLYLWQQPLFAPEVGGWLASWPMNVILALIAAELSYRLVEQPFLRLRSRLQASAAPSRRASGAILHRS